RHAARSGSAAFLFPSTATVPDSCLPPSINSVDICEVAQIHDLFFQAHAKTLPDRRPAALDQLPDIGGGRRAFVDNEVAVRRRHARAADRDVLQSGPIDESARRPRNALGHPIAARLGGPKDATGARALEGLRLLSV